MFLKKSKILAVCLSVSFLLLTVNAVFAASYGGSRGFSSSRSTSSAFKSLGSSSSKQSFKTSKTSSSSSLFSNKSGSKNSSNIPPLVTKKGFAGTSVFDKNQAQVTKQHKATMAKNAFASDVGKFKNYKPQVYKSKVDLPKNAQSNPLFSSTRVKSTDNYTTFSNNKQKYYNKIGWAPKPYMYTNSSYGGYDGLLFWMMLDSMGDMAMMSALYNQSNQPGFAEWKAEAEKQAKTDEKVAKQLEEMNAKLAAMEGEKDPSKLPEGMLPDVALANDALLVADKELVKFSIATGEAKGIYCKGGNLLKEAAKETINVVNINTAGTMENIKLLDQGKVDGFIGQKDSIDSYASVNPTLVKELRENWITLYKEPVQLIANRKSGIKSITDLDSKHTVYVGKEGSGSESTWIRFMLANPDYKKVNTKNADQADALKAVIKDPNAVMFFVSGLNSAFTKAVDAIAATEGLRFVKINDRAITKSESTTGEELFSYAKIPAKTFPNLQKRWFFKRSTKTVATESVFVVSPKWIEKNGKEALDDLVSAVIDVQPKIYEAANGEL